MTNMSLGAFPCFSPERAMTFASEGVINLAIGTINIGHVQICPQNGPEIVNERYIDRLRDLYPETNFRLHANARILTHSMIFDLGSMDRMPEYRKRLVSMLKYLGEGYSIHSGRSENLDQEVSRCQKLEQDSGVPVGIEGLYPGTNSPLSTWEAYEKILHRDVRYAVDLSHLNIVRTKEGNPPEGLVEALLSGDNCMEVHLSGNNGQKDSHEPVGLGTWWLPLIENINKNAVVFYEGRQRS